MTCLSAEALERFLSGHSPDGAAVEAHVSVCPDCRSALDRMSDNPELKRWVERAVALPTELAEDSVLKQLLTELGSADGGLPQHEKAGKRESHWHAGRVLGQYRVVEEIGRGGMGVVLRAHDELLGRTVALKVLRSLEIEPKARARLVHEAKAVAKLRHDNVVTLHAVVNPPDDAPYLVMEYVAGGTLAILIKEQGRLDPKRAAAIVAEVADGLETAHAAGLIHRDIKPSNILVDAVSGRAKITDFGLARSTEHSGLTQESTVAGTPTHMSPEQARGGKDLDCRCDIYSLGVTLYEALTGTVPFHGAPHMVFQQVLAEAPLPPRRLNDKVPRDLETICLKAMAKEPGRRYQRARELAEDLRHWQCGEPIHARPVGRLERSVSWCRRRPLVAGLLLALTLAFAGGVAGISWNWAEAVRQRRQMEVERDRAQRNFQQAREAVDTYLTQVSENSALKEQNLEPLRRELLRTARDFYERFVQQDPDDPDLQAELGKAHGRLGQITGILESMPKALAHFQKMGEIFERLHSRYPGNPAYQQELAESYLWLGDCQRTGGGTSAHAVKAFERSRALQEDLVRAHPEEPTHRHNLARSWRSLGQYAVFMTHDFAKAEEALLAARDIYERLPSSYLQRPTVQYDRARLLSTLAKLYAHTDRPEDHRAAAEAAIAAFEPLSLSHDGNPDDVCYFADSLSELADAYRRLGQPDLAETTLQRALRPAEDLVRLHPANGYYQHLVADIDYSLASVEFHERQEPVKARAHLEKALEIELKLNRSYPGAVEYGFYLGNLFRDLRDWFGDTARLTALHGALTTAIQEHEAKMPAATPVDERIAHCYAERASINRVLGRYREALADISHVEPANLVYVAFARAQQGDYAAAESAAKTLTQGTEGSAAYEAARLGAYLVFLIRNDRALPAARREELAEKHGSEAVQRLEKARSMAYLSSPSTRFLLTDDRDLDSLRTRSDFQALLARQHEKPRAGK
jgi:tetratricopeptide (TPR) repeat protein